MCIMEPLQRADLRERLLRNMNVVNNPADTTLLSDRGDVAKVDDVTLLENDRHWRVFLSLVSLLFGVRKPMILPQRVRCFNDYLQNGLERLKC